MEGGEDGATGEELGLYFKVQQEPARWFSIKDHSFCRAHLFLISSGFCSNIISSERLHGSPY